jgi:predicted transcriptional regulator
MPEMTELTELQIDILRVLWERGEASVADVWEVMHPQRGLAQTTIATLLTRLERRGVVSRRAEQRTYVYRAQVSESDVRQSMVGGLTERMFDGDVTALVNHLLTTHEMAPGDLARLRAMIDAAETEAELPEDR